MIQDLNWWQRHNSHIQYLHVILISILGVDIFIEKEHFGRALKVYEAESQPLPLTLESFYLTFILYIVGLVAATAIFLYEMYFKKTSTVN